MLTALTRGVLARRWLVLSFWLLAFAAALLAVGPTNDALTNTISVPGREGFATNDRILATYGNGGEAAPVVMVVRLPRGTTVDSPGIKDEIGRVDARVEARAAGVRLASYASTGDRGFVSADGRTTYTIVFSPPSAGAHQPPAATEAVREVAAAADVAGERYRVTGLDVQEEAPRRPGLSAAAEGAIGIAAALLLLLIAFRSALALLPVLMAVVSIACSFALLWFATLVTDVWSVISVLMVLIGLGISIDYALLLVTRWREELDAGRSNDDAVLHAVATAGRAVVVSGLTVAVGLLSLVVLPVPFLRSLGYGGMLIPLVAIVVQLSLLPVVLATVGPRLDRVRLTRRRAAEPGAGWARWGAVIVRRPLLWAVAALAVLAFLIVPAASLNVRTPRAEALVAERSVREGLTLLERAGIGAGPLAPIEVEAPAGYARSAAARLREVPGVRAVLAPSGSDWSRNGIALLTVIPTSDTNSPEGRDTLASVRDAAGRLPGVHVGGSSAQSVDFVSAIYGSFPAMLALIVLVTFLFLARAFRSLLLPLKAILLNLVSVAASLGAVQLVWQRGWGSELLWGVPATGSVPEFVPLMVFAFLFGISMDYEVFILSRMREEYDRSGVTARAVTEGMRRTGRLVTLAGLVLIAAFVSLATNASTVVNIFASALAFGILIDATIVRAVLVPALVALMGRWNWWLPTWAGRLFRLSPDGVTAEPVRATE